MNRIVVDVPNDKMQAFEEAMLRLGLTKTPDADIPEEHKSIVREIIATSGPEDYGDFRTAIEDIRRKK
jgi:hypothetical protein